MRELDKALEHHRAGRLQEAEALYRSILAGEPAHADALHLLGVLAHQRGAHGEAVALIDQAIRLAPDEALYHSNRGEALRAQGRQGEAIAAYHKALALQPDNAAAYSNLGLALQNQGDVAAAEDAYRRSLALVADAETQCNFADLLQERGRFEEALTAYEAALALRSNFAEAHNGRGAVLRELGRATEAVAAFEQAVLLNPDYAEAYYNLGITHDEHGRGEAAIAAYRKAVGCKPDFFAACYRLGHALQARGDLQGAVSAYRRAIELKPGFAEAHNSLGSAFKALGHLDEAIASYRQALKNNPNDALAHYNLGNVYWNRNELEHALARYEQALALKPDFAAAHNNAGNVLVALGRMDEAKAVYRNALRFQSGHAEAMANLVNIQKYDSVAHEDVGAIRTWLSASDLSEEDSIHLHFALGKIYDDCGSWDEAFLHYSDANRLKRKRVQFGLSNLIAGIDRSIRLFDSAFFADHALGSTSELPLFVVGMPRSGTTLVEQIISSHPEVHGVGESVKIREIVNNLMDAAGGRYEYPECIEYVDPNLLSKLAEEFENSLRLGTSPGVRRVSDKTPRNYLHLGLISVLFPRARVIHCLRDPLDTCLSIYFHDFPPGDDYAYDLDEIGGFYREYRRLMAHWRDVLPLRIHEVHYEDLVADQEAKTRELIEFLGIEWDPRCLSFNKNPRAVLTASTWQVRQTIYRRSVKRWRNYERHLGPLKQALGMDS